MTNTNLSRPVRDPRTVSETLVNIRNLHLPQTQNQLLVRFSVNQNTFFITGSFQLMIEILKNSIVKIYLEYLACEQLRDQKTEFGSEANSSLCRYS